MSTAMFGHPLRTSVRLNEPVHPASLNGPDLLLGLAAGDRPVTIGADAGPVLVVTDASGGTTTLLRTVAAQALARGAQVDIIDVTRSEHTWAIGLDHARHLTGAAAIHDYLVAAAGELAQDACTKTDGWRGRRVLVIEQLDMLVTVLRHYWQHTRPETQLEEAPGVEALTVVLSAGRARGWTVIAGEGGATGPGRRKLGPEAFTTRILGQAGQLVWRRLAPDVNVPAYSATRGRLHLVSGQTPTAFQALHLSEAQARALALHSADTTVRRSA